MITLELFLLINRNTIKCLIKVVFLITLASNYWGKMVTQLLNELITSVFCCTSKLFHKLILSTFRFRDVEIYYYEILMWQLIFIEFSCLEHPCLFDVLVIYDTDADNKISSYFLFLITSTMIPDAKLCQPKLYFQHILLTVYYLKCVDSAPLGEFFKCKVKTINSVTLLGWKVLSIKKPYPIICHIYLSKNNNNYYNNGKTRELVILMAKIFQKYS